MVPNPLKSLMIGVFLAMCAALLIRPYWSHDIWWHIKCGELIVKEHQWPSPDVFTCTVDGEPWLVHSWFSQCILYITDSLVGEAGLQAWDTLLRVVFVALVWLASGRLPGGFGVRLLATANAAFLCATLESRPHIAVPIFLLLLATSKNLCRPDRRAPLWTIPLMALWSNVHPSMLLGQFFLGVCLVQRVAATGKLKRDSLVITAAILAGFVNPYHFRLIHFALFENRAYDFVTIREWLSPFAVLPESFIDVLVLIANTVLFFYICEKTLIRQRPLGLSLAVQAAGAFVFLITAYTSFRFMFLSTIALYPILSAEATETASAKSDKKEYVSTTATASLLLYFIVLLIGKPTYARDWFDLKEATAFLNEIEAEGNIFNDFSFGGRIIYDCYPRIKVFADGRIGPFEEEVFPLYVKVFEDAPTVGLEILNTYHIGWVLIQEVTQPAWMNEERGFEEIYRHRGIVIFKREDAFPSLRGET